MSDPRTWICAAGLGDSQSEQAAQDSEQLLLWKETPTAKPSCESTGPACPSTTTSDTSKGLAYLTLLRLAFRAKLHRCAVSGAEVTTSMDAGSGLTSSGSSATHDPGSHSWKTQQACFPWMEEKHGLESYLNFTPSGLICGGKLWEATQLVRPTNDSGSGSWLPTPSGVNGGTNHTAGRLDEWGGQANPFRGTSLGPVRCAIFEEWMMGLAIRHTELTPSEMPSPRKSLSTS